LEDLMKVFQKDDLHALLDRLRESCGAVHGPVRRLDGGLVFGTRGGEEVCLEAGLPINSSSDLILRQIETVVEQQSLTGRVAVTNRIVLFGVRPCDLRGLRRIELRLKGLLGPEFVTRHLCSLVVAQACLVPGVNCFCRSTGGNPAQAPGADLLLFDAGACVYVRTMSERGVEFTAAHPKIFRDPTLEEDRDLARLLDAPAPTSRLPDVRAAKEVLTVDGREPDYLQDFNKDCVSCGSCAVVCPVHTPWISAITADGASASESRLVDREMRLTERRLPYRRKLLHSRWETDEVECTGCGRCSTRCPSGLGMIETVDGLNGLPWRHESRRRSQGSDTSRWMQQVLHKVATPDGAFSRIRPGDSVFIASGCAEPQFLTRALMLLAPKFLDVQVIHLLSMGSISFDDPALKDHLRLNSFFVGDMSCKAVASGNADYTPVFLSELPDLIRGGRMRVDVAVIQVSPPDAHGYCSLGISVETVRAAALHARCVVAQINSNMPRTHGDSMLHTDEIDAFVPFDEPLIEWRPPPLDENSRKIGRYIAGLIEDGATLQIGIGKIGQALLPYLRDKKDLGIHTQVISDEAIELIKNGVVTNMRKRLHPGKTIASFAVGTRKMYDTLHGNSSIEFYGMDYVADPTIISRNHKMTAINSAFEVDLSGQVCGDSIQYQFYSGIASMADFLRGAARSEGGKPIVALPSTARDGAVSRIVPQLLTGHPAVVTRGDVHYVVTEYGVAYLHGKSIRERALALIEIAHPRYRTWLLDEAKELKYVFPDQELPSLTTYVYPEEWETTVQLKDGQQVLIRPVKATDEPALQRLYYSLSDQDVFLRFMGSNPHFPHHRMQAMTVVDYDRRVALVAVRGPLGNEEILGIGRYDIAAEGDIAEVAFTVRDDFRRKHLGKKLLHHLMAIARGKGVKGFRAEILAQNKSMMKLFNTAGTSINSSEDDGLYTMWYYFDGIPPSEP
jgi:acyl-CoA hydrolase/ferredoxin/GNAT superfamily N-acetyltransferase